MQFVFIFVSLKKIKYGHQRHKTPITNYQKQKRGMWVPFPPLPCEIKAERQSYSGFLCFVLTNV